MHTSFSHRAALSTKRPRQDWGDSGASDAVWQWLGLVYPRSPTVRPYTQAAQVRPEGLRCMCRCVGVAGPCVSSFSHGGSLSPKRPGGPEGLGCICRCVGVAGPYAYLILPRCVPIHQAAEARPGGLRCIRRCVGVPAPCAYLVLDGASISPKRPGQGQRDPGVSAAVWGWLDLVYPRSPTGRPYPPSGASRTGGTRVYPPLCGRGCTLCIPRSPTGRPYRQSSLGRTGGTRVYPPLCGSRWTLCIPRFPTGRPYPPSGPGTTGGTRVYPPLRGSGCTLCMLVLPRGVPTPQAAQARPVGLGCIRRCVGVGAPCVCSSSHGASLPPKRPRHDRWDSGVSAVVWEWLGPMHTAFSHGASLSPKRPTKGGGDLGVAAAVWEWLDLVILVLPRCVATPQAAEAGPEGLGCIRRLVEVDGPYAYLVLPRCVPIPQAAHAGPEGLRCIRRCVRVAGPCVSSFSHGPSLSRRRLGSTRGTRVYPPLFGSGRALCIPRSPTGRPYPPSGRGGTGDLGWIRRCVGVAGPCVSSFPHMASLSPKRPR